MKRLVLSILVRNLSGVLSRVTGLFSRRGYNIDSLTVGVTQDPTISRITVVATGNDQILDQIKKQLAKLYDVIQIIELPEGESVYRELALIKVEANETTRPAIVETVGIFRAKIVDVAPDSLTIEITGDFPKIEAFIEILKGYNIKELVQTGLTGVTRGITDARQFN